MRDNRVRKGLVFGIIVLFVGVSIAPGINASIETSESQSPIIEQETLNNDLVEITVQVGKEDHIMMLTPQQAEKLESLINSTKTKLDVATTVEETSCVFNDTILAFYELGIFPVDTTIRELQELVNIKNQYSRVNKLKEGLMCKSLGTLDNEENLLCLIAGNTDATDYFGPFGTLFMIPTNIILLILFRNCLNYIWQDFIDFYKELMGIIPIAFANTIYIGSFYFRPFGGWGHFSSHGWIHSIGLNGIKKWIGPFIGNLSGFLSICWLTGEMGCFWGLCPGVLGFSGIKIHFIENDDDFYLGTALHVKITEEPAIGG